jgi:hypothetical protein
VDNGIPRPLRDARLLGLIRGLDGMYACEKRVGSVVVKIHYDNQGEPSKAWVQPRVQIDLKDEV